MMDVGRSYAGVFGISGMVKGYLRRMLNSGHHPGLTLSRIPRARSPPPTDIEHGVCEGVETVTLYVSPFSTLLIDGDSIPTLGGTHRGWNQAMRVISLPWRLQRTMA